MSRQHLTWISAALFAATLSLTGCPGASVGPVSFQPDPITTPEARPYFSSTTNAVLMNNTGSTYQISGLTVSAEIEEQASAFRVAFTDPALGDAPLLGPGESFELLVTFSPILLGDYNATVTAITRLVDYSIGGGGCSAGCGSDAPSDSEYLASAALIGRADAEAPFEDCDDGIDNDADGLIDCDDPDCFADPDCQGETEDCTDGIDNDGDGLIDCDDPDCALDPSCGVIVGCEPSGGIDCGGTVTSTTLGAADNWQDYCDAGFDQWAGGESIWTFQPSASGAVEVAAFAFDWDLDLTVLEAVPNPDGELSCDPQACVATSWNPPNQPGEFAEFDAVQGRLYFIVIDGWGGSAGEFELQVQCATGGVETECGDGLDNDGDGRVDCDDDDCIGSPDCGGEGFCQPVGNVTCPATIITGDTGGPEATNLVSDWCGEGFDGWSGPEIAYSFIPSTTGVVQINAGGLSADLDMVVLLADPTAPPGLSCDPDLCVDQSFSGGQTPEFIEFQAFVGTEYIIALDGWDGATSTFQLVVDCAGGGEVCDDGVDNDGDGQIDCADPDCVLFPGCQGGAEDCFNGIDDDGDGLVDCDDVPDCQAAPGCDYGTGDCCTDNGSPGCENDLGEDCVCAADPFCCETGWDALCADIFETFCGGTCNGQDPEIDCANGADDDNDGLTDCDDADCFLDPNCLGPQVEFSCTNGVDDDGDGAVDCDDTDCALHPACQTTGTEICDDGIDNDADADVDCDDSDCIAEPVCDAGDGECCAANGSPGCEDEPGEDCVCSIDPFCCNVAWDSICADEYENQCGGVCTGAEDCTNGVDDDGDNLVDCADPDCITDPNCGGPGVELACTDNVDNDADGLTDCDDPDCAGDPSCVVPGTETDCADGLDNDQDGSTDCGDSDCTFEPACDAGDGDCCTANGSPGCVDEPGEDCVCAADPFCCNNQWDAICASEYQNQCGGSCAGTEICTNGLDDDGDGFADCDDSDCAAEPSCLPPPNEIACTNGFDDDLDGLTDCDDPDCFLNPACNIPPTEISCNDGVDNDQDGLVDCADSDCATFPGCVNPPETNCANGIDDDADGLTDCNDSDCQFNPNCAHNEFDCADGVDNDLDGQVDCADGDCSADIACVSTGVCNPVGNLTCGSTIFASNFGSGSTNQQDVYCGYNPGGWFGPEISWIFTPTWNGFVDITLTGLTQDLDIQALVQDGAGCDPNDCEANGWNPPPQPEQMDWFAFAGTPYYILIDGWQGAQSSFTLTVTCTPLNEQDCADGLDDDNDGQIDCADIDCLGSAACPETVCTDGVDNDADGFIDCADVDCFGTLTCIPEFLCSNGLDDDFDGNVDCADPDCAADPSCFVPTTETICSNGVDDDGDGFTDCADSDCASSTACNAEICGDGFDNDGDGDEDCFDTDCAGDPTCIGETVCDDNFDNDADGFTDCLDTDCLGAPGCPVVLFSSVDDDPNDFSYVALGQNNSGIQWELDVPDTAAQSGGGPLTAFGGTQAWCTGCDQSVDSNGRFQGYLVANPNVFALAGFTTGTLVLSFEHWQVSPGIPWIDLSRVDASPDAGATINVEWGPSVASTGGWDHVEIDLSAYLGGDLTFGFRYDTLFAFGGGQSDDGWYIDDVQLIWYP